MIVLMTYCLMFQDFFYLLIGAPDHRSFEELKDLAQDQKSLRGLVVAIEPKNTLELQKNEEDKKLRSHKCNGS